MTQVSRAVRRALGGARHWPEFQQIAGQGRGDERDIQAAGATRVEAMGIGELRVVCGWNRGVRGRAR